MALTNAEKQARFRARRAAELKVLRKLAAKIQPKGAIQSAQAPDVPHLTRHGSGPHPVIHTG
jgi:hypothetical protein